MLRAIIFDFDGVLVDSEPLIKRVTREMAAQEGWTITDEEYFREFLALDDRRIVEHLYRRHGRPIDVARRDELVRWKARVYMEAIRDGLPPPPGSIEFVRSVAAQFPLAIASGSLRAEVEYLLIKLGLRPLFPVVVTAEDCDCSKPHPEIYQRALRGLQQLDAFRKNPLLPAECLAIEDAPGGVDAAHAAEMKCLALTHSRAAHELRHADWVFKSFQEVDLPTIQAAFR